MVPEINAKGGILGRKVEIILEDEKGDPANAVRKARKLVEEDKVNLIIGTTLSSCALAVSAMLPTWKVPMMSVINGTSELTGSKYNRYFFRMGHSSPMEAKALSLYIKDDPKLKTFYGIGTDYAWPRTSVGAFEKDILKMPGKKWLGSIFSPLATTDYATYIAKIKEAKPDGLFAAVPGADAVAFYRQAREFGLTKETQFIVSILPLLEIIPTGDATEGFIGHSRYTLTIDNPKNKAFVERFYKDTKIYPDFYHALTYDGMNFFMEVAKKAGTDDPDAIIKAWEGAEHDGVMGKFTMRACDHQAMLRGFVVKAVKEPGYPHLITKILKIYPAEQIVPGCRKDYHE
jgi:branched-chain amino acid transport system substrate-binding protein